MSLNPREMKIRVKVEDGKKNLFGYSRPVGVECGRFTVCEYAGTEADGGRCHRCGANHNLKESESVT